MNEQEKFNVLAVDDTSSNLLALEAIFQGTKYRIIRAASGIEAIKILSARQDIFLVLLDIQMPDMDGFRTASRIKEIKGYHELPIILISAFYEEDANVIKGLRAGCIDFFNRPFDPELLKMKVDMYASLYHRTLLLKEREEKIRNTEELLTAGRKLSDVLENVAVGVIIEDQDGNIVQTNEAVSKILGTSRATKNDDYGAVLEWWKKNRDVFHVGEHIHNKRLELRAMNGDLLHLMVSSSPLKGMNNEILGAVLVLQDLTERKKLEDEFEERLSQLVSLGVELEHHARHH